MRISNPFARLFTSSSQRTSKSKKAYVHLKGKKSREVVKAARLYAKYSDSLKKEITTYSNIKGRVMTNIATEEGALKRLKAELREHRTTVRALPTGRAKSLLLQKTKILLEQARATKERLATARGQLKKLSAQHKEKYDKLNRGIQQLERYIKKRAPDLKAVTRKTSKSSKANKNAKTKGASKSSKKKTNSSASAKTYSHITKEMSQQTKKAQAMLTKWQGDLKSSISKYSALKGDILANISKDKANMKGPFNPEVQHLR